MIAMHVVVAVVVFFALSLMREVFVPFFCQFSIEFQLSIAFARYL